MVGDIAWQQEHLDFVCLCELCFLISQASRVQSFADGNPEL